MSKKIDAMFAYQRDLLTEHYSVIIETPTRINELDTTIENKWIFPIFIRKDTKTGTFKNLKEEWTSVLEEKEEVTKKIRGIDKVSREFLSEKKRTEKCNAIYAFYDIQDTKTYQFDYLYYFFRRDVFLREPKNKQFIENLLSEVEQTLAFIDSLGRDRTEAALITRQKQAIITQIDLTQNIKDNDTLSKRDVKDSYCYVITQLDEEIPFEGGDIDLWEYFDRVKLTDNIPFCTYKTFYKFRENTTVNPDWLEEDEDSLVFYVQYDGEYQKMYMTPSTIIAQLTLNEVSTPTSIITNISNVFGIPDLKSDPSHQKSIKATSYITVPERIDNLKLLLFFIHSHPIYSKFVFAEESRVVMTDRHYLFLTYYTNPVTPKEFVSFNIRNVEADDVPKMTCTPTSKAGKAYIQLTIRHCPNQELIKNTVSMLLTLLEDYTRNKQVINGIFTSLSLNKPIMKPIIKDAIRTSTSGNVLKGKTRGQYHYPNKLTLDAFTGKDNPLALSFYHTNLETEPVDIRITPEQNQQLKSADAKQGMIFPKVKSKEDEEQYMFVCDREPAYKYIDLREIQVDGKNELVPSCYTTDKMLNYENSKLYKYMKDIQDDTKVSKGSSYIIKTGKCLEPNHYGLPLSWITRWYALHKPDTFLYRKGISNDAKRSILYLLETVKHSKIPASEHINRKHIELIKAMRDAPPYDILTESKKVHPTKTMDELCQQFESGYIDPLVFYSFLSRHYDMELVFFKKDELQKDFYLTHPPYTHIYQSRPTKMDTQVVGIVLNQGTEFFVPEFPLCELLISSTSMPSMTITSKTPQLYTLTNSKDYINACLKKMYNQTIYELTMLFEFPIRSQTVDVYGMTTWVNVEYDSRHYSVCLLEPIHSLNVPLNDAVRLWTEDVIRALEPRMNFKKRGGSLFTQVYELYKGYVCTYKEKDYFLPVRENDNGVDMMTEYKRYEKLARYIKEYTCYAFSLYIKSNPEHTLDNIYGSIDSFIKDGGIQVNPLPEPTYMLDVPNVLRRLANTTNTFFDVRTGTVTVTSDDVLRKLVYMLLLECQTRKEDIITYASRLYMRNYYVHPHDFTYHPMHKIINKAALSVFIAHQSDVIPEGRVKHKPSERDNHSNFDPYVLYKRFPELNDLSTESWLMQPVSSLEQAVFLSKKWNETRINAVIEWRNLLILDNTEETDIKPSDLHQFVWQSETIYNYTPPRLPSEHVPYLSIFRYSTKKVYIQVMLPLN